MIAGEEYPKRPRKGSVLPQVLLMARFERRSGRKLLSDCSELSADTRNISATLFGGRLLSESFPFLAQWGFRAKQVADYAASRGLP